MTFDTSGHFHIMPGHPLHRFMAVNQLRFETLTLLAQGYVRAAGEFAGCGFTGFASETMAAMLADCEAFHNPSIQKPPEEVRGAGFWQARQQGDLALYPPLTAVTDDAGVHLR